MTRSVVFKTPGKLDLRSIMTFGLNAKPATGHPIGFFGTGLKYAIAVLTRRKIPVTLYIDGKKWTFDTEKSKFRDKEVTEVFLIRNRGKVLPRHIKKLPFTTELGKTWELWQAFRELYSNTLDEAGETFIMHNGEGESADIVKIIGKGFTGIVVVSEEFTQEYLDRQKTFLPEGMTLQETVEDIQIFDRPSKHIYYRGIRVQDLKEPSQLTYNILRKIELTEDRTAKSAWDIQYYISQAISGHSKPEIITKAITAPKQTYERSLNFSYGVPSKEFLDTVESSKSAVDPSAKEVLKQYRPPKVKAQTDSDWFAPIIKAIEEGNWDEVENNIQPYREEVIQILKKAQAEWQKEQNANAYTKEHELSVAFQEAGDPGSETPEDGDIPF